MERIRRIKKIKGILGNSGSTFIVVIVAVSFLSILGTVIIAVSAANLQMKRQEYAVTQNFYSDERILDDIYHGIGKAASNYLSQAYTEILARSSDATAVYGDQEAAYQAFSRDFVVRLIGLYGDAGVPLDDDTKDRLNSYITVEDLASEPSVYLDSFRAIRILDNNERNIGASDITGTTQAVPYKYIFEGLQVVFQSTDSTGVKTGYESVITTDIVIEVPYVNFFQDSTRILEYALIANQGIYFTNSSTAGGGRQVIGNVYAGINAGNTVDTVADLELYRGIDPTVSQDTVRIHGGLNIANSGTVPGDVSFESNYLVSKGDINIRNSKVTIGGDLSSSKVWAESIRTLQKGNRRSADEPSALTVNGDVYVANDLELNAAKSTVRLDGSYYGYNGGKYTTWEYKGQAATIPDIHDTSAAHHPRSSSIIINGNNSILDIRELDVLVIAGMAYVDYTRYAGENYGAPPTSNTEYAMGESLALRASQYLYLAPKDKLTETNPVKVSAGTPAFDVDKLWPNRDNGSNPDEWFGFEDNMVKKDDPIEERRVTDPFTGQTYCYFYLKFADVSGKGKYAQLILNMQDPHVDSTGGIADSAIRALFTEEDLKEMWNLKQAIRSSVEYSGITIEEDITGTNIYTAGTMIKAYDDSSGIRQVEPMVPGSTLDSAYATELENYMFQHYIALYEELDPREGIALDRFIPGVANDESGNLAGSMGTGAPAQRYVDLARLKTAGRPATPNTYRDDNNVNSLSIVSTVDVDLKFADYPVFNGIILCSGNVTIEDGVTVNGLVVAGGKIYVKGNGVIQANRGIVQNILNEEMLVESQRGATNGTTIPAFAITYLQDINLSSTAVDYSNRVIGTEYTDYMSYAGWRKS